MRSSRLFVFCSFVSMNLILGGCTLQEKAAIQKSLASDTNEKTEAVEKSGTASEHVNSRCKNKPEQKEKCNEPDDGGKNAKEEEEIDTNPCQSDLRRLLSLSDQKIFELGRRPGTLGQCYIADGRNTPYYCDYYVISAVVGSRGAYGYPKNPYSGDSTGCVVAPTLPKGVNYCWGGYDPSTMCTNDYVKNAANQLRQAIVDGACGCKK